MPHITINDAAKAMLESDAAGKGVNLDPLAERQPDGLWGLEINQATFDRMNRVRQPGESNSDLLLRLEKAWNARHRAPPEGGHRNKAF